MHCFLKGSPWPWILESRHLVQELPCGPFLIPWPGAALQQSTNLRATSTELIYSTAVDLASRIKQDQGWLWDSDACAQHLAYPNHMIWERPTPLIGQFRKQIFLINCCIWHSLTPIQRGRTVKLLQSNSDVQGLLFTKRKYFPLFFTFYTNCIFFSTDIKFISLLFDTYCQHRVSPLCVGFSHSSGKCLHLFILKRQDFFFLLSGIVFFTAYLHKMLTMGEI